ncbi:hypothetical protein, partial [Ammoniphilus sp. 3BR4]|uniref:hypothetical protein n=1 Tax=Ammoniphilus sp. 3BR4 TaxID=3158265 RepID=UPI0034675B5F
MNQRKKKSERKWVPLVMSTSLLTAAFISAGAPASANELGKAEQLEEALTYKNHGQQVSEVATTTDGGPGKGAVVNEAAQNKGEGTVDAEELAADAEQPVEQEPADDTEQPADQDLAADAEQPVEQEPADDTE